MEREVVGVWKILVEREVMVERKIMVERDIFMIFTTAIRTSPLVKKLKKSIHVHFLWI